MSTSSKPPVPQAVTPAEPAAPRQCDAICPRCGSGDLAKVKGCVVCLQCHYKQDCNGW
jgi:hypothetical protein